MNDVKRISPQEAFASMKNGYVYVDVRTEQEFADGHADGAMNVPIAHMGGGGMIPNADFVSVMEKAFGKDAKIIVGCKAGGRSLRAAQALLRAGFADVLDQRAGWDGVRDPFGQMSEPGWSRASLPIGRGEPDGRAYADVKKRALG
jgi:rhodanese-related sulfurtransferase